MKIRFLRFALLVIGVLFLLMSCAMAQTFAFVEIPQSVSVISEESFYQAESLTEALLPDNVERIESRAFASSGLKHINLPASIDYIAPDAFDGCENLMVSCDKGSYAYDYCMSAGIEIEPPPLSVFILQNENEKTCAVVEAEMDAAFAEASKSLDKRLRIHRYTCSADSDQAHQVETAVQMEADIVLLNLVKAGSAAAYTQAFSDAQIPVLYFNTEPKAAAVQGFDALFVGSKNKTRPDSAELAQACAQIAVNRLRNGEWLSGTDYTSESGWSVLLKPLYRLAGLKIGIDPGHQRTANYGKEPVAPGSSTMKAKVSSGTYGVVTKTREYVRTLQISKKLKAALEAQGAQVYMTRETHDVNISNVERAKMMNKLKVDLVLRIHCDGASVQSANGISLYVKKSGDKAQESLDAANAILPAMIKATGAYKRGVKRSSDYSGLNWSTVPSILVECGFMTNKDEDRRLADPKYQQKLADGMTNGVIKYFKR